LYEKLCNILGKKETKFIYNDNGTEVEETVANIEFLSGDDSIYRRQVVFEGVERGYCTLLIGSTISDEGLNLPKLDTLILAGGGKSSTRAYQRIGRVMRLYPGKNKCFVFDFDDETPIFHRHARCRRKLYEEEEEFVIKDFEVTV
jgi:superfamily II DNA or RNA helicase